MALRGVGTDGDSRRVLTRPADVEIPQHRRRSLVRSAVRVADGDPRRHRR